MYFFYILGFVQILNDEVVSLWAVNDVKDGGINFGSTQLGTYFMVQGIILIIYQTFIFPLLINRFGCLKLFRFGMLVSAPAIALIPLSVLVVEVKIFIFYFFYFLFFLFFTFLFYFYFKTKKKGAVQLWSLLVALSLLKVVGFVSAFTCIFMMINHSAVPSQLGGVNGLAQSMVAFARGNYIILLFFFFI